MPCRSAPHLVLFDSLYISRVYLVYIWYIFGIYLVYPVSNRVKVHLWFVTHLATGTSDKGYCWWRLFGCTSRGSGLIAKTSGYKMGYHLHCWFFCANIKANGLLNLSAGMSWAAPKYDKTLIYKVKHPLSTWALQAFYHPSTTPHCSHDLSHLSPGSAQLISAPFRMGRLLPCHVGRLSRVQSCSVQPTWRHGGYRKTMFQVSGWDSLVGGLEHFLFSHILGF